jgi:hypothetical protein
MEETQNFDNEVLAYLSVRKVNLNFPLYIYLQDELIDSHK